jgi:RNA polymerase sigma-70 factor (sigma-E family)
MMALLQPPRRADTRAAFEHFVDGCAGGLLRTAYLIVWDPAEAEDLVQETLLRVARRWPRVRRMDQPAAYARRILVNLATDGARRRSRRRLELAPADGAALESHADELSARVFGAVEDRVELFEALALLPPRQRAVLVLRYFEDLSEAETARTLGCSLGTVKSSASRALGRLRETLEPDAAAAACGNGHLIDTKERQP